MENMMKNKIKSMKQEQKERAQEIRSLKSTRKQCDNGYVPGLGSTQWNYRSVHIAYCLLRGRKPEEIENRWKPEKMEEKDMVWKRAYKIVEQIKGEQDEAVCTSA
jgi:hypothetical protein